jgi:hypothetical protein
MSVLRRVWSLAVLVYGMKSKQKTSNSPVTPGILFFFLIQSAVMNYFTFVNGLPAYLIMMFLLGSLGHYMDRAGWILNLEKKFNSTLVVIVLSPHITALYLLIRQLVSLLWLYTLS